MELYKSIVIVLRMDLAVSQVYLENCFMTSFNHQRRQFSSLVAIGKEVEWSNDIELPH